MHIFSFIDWRDSLKMRIIVKVGTSTLTHPSGHLNIRHMENFCKVLSDLKNAGHEIILVSSGAIAMGMGKLSLRERPSAIAEKQAAAAVGQCELMYIYDKLFSEYNHVVAQILLTAADVGDHVRRTNFIGTVFNLLKMQVLPIVNENDTVATDEITEGLIGDNDTLGAIVATSLSADLLILLSDIDGLYTDDPRTSANAEFIPIVTEITPELTSHAGGKGTQNGTGGMATKLKAAKISMDAGVDMIIANGKNPEILYDIVDGKQVGTRFKGKARI
jgi:glutamate 5-kinase